ncbi:MAG: GTP-binding protein [Solobacterium sp.]|nr:GTP-binding protein [Solobacterium sp.]
MINVYIISGFLGAGKTTFIQKLLKEHKFDKVMLLENEFGEVGVDSAFFDSSLKMKEINNGCICCSLQGDFEKALEEIEEMGITDLLIEPSGVGKLSDIIDVVKKDSDFRIISHICIVDVKTASKYHNNFKEYFDDQVKAANALVLSHLDVADEDKVNSVKEMLREVNPDVDILDTSIEEMNISDLLNVIVSGGEIMPEFDEHHHHHDEDEECDCCCGHHHEHHHHHHHHDADEDFVNIALRPEYVFDKEELESILSKMDEDVIRVKGYVNGKEGTLYLNYVLNEYHVFYGEKKDESLVVAIGSKLDEQKIREAFHD